jgi:hypothetical protein
VSSHSGDQASTQELTLARAPKLSKNFSSGSLVLSLAEKSSAANVGIRGRKKSLPQTGVSGMGTSSKALDLFGSGSSASEDEAIAPVPHRKHPQMSPPKTFSKPSDVPPMKGTSIPSCCILFYFLCLLYLTFVLSVSDFRLVGFSLIVQKQGIRPPGSLYSQIFLIVRTSG